MKLAQRWSLLTGLVLSLQAHVARADDQIKQPPRALAGEAKTLPEKVVRMRLPYRQLNATQGYSAEGAAEESGFRFAASALAAVVEYGYSNAISLQFVLPFVLKNDMGMDGDVFQRSSNFTMKLDEFVLQASRKLVDDGLCASLEACQDAINNKGLSLPYDTTLILPTGESLPVKKGVPLRTLASSVVTRAAVPRAGRTGPGDLEVGALFSLADSAHGLFKKDAPVNVSAGLGLRVPTGSFFDVTQSQRPTGRGTLDLGIRANVDWQPHDYFVLSAQNQSEIMVLAGQRKRSSLLDSSQLNRADPMQTGADQIKNTAEFRRNGMRNIGFLKSALGLAVLADSVSFLSVNLLFKYDFDTQTSLGGQVVSPASDVQSVQAGVMFDGLSMSLPLQWELDYEIPLSGRGRTLAPTAVSSTLKAFYRL